MIGIVNRTKVFEFRDEGELSYALSWFCDKYDSSIIFIVDQAERIKAIIKNGDFTFAPNLNDETNYYIYGINDKTPIQIDDIGKNDILPVIRDIQAGPFPFIYKTQRVPKEIDL